SPMSFSTAQTVQQQSISSFSAQWAALTAYAKREAFRFVLGVVSFISLAAALFWTRQRMRRLSTENSGVCLTIPIFERPIAAALILSLLVSRWIYPQAPRLLWAIIGVIALIPSVSILRRLITPNLYPLLYALIVFFLTDHLRTVAAAIEFLPRIL